MNLYGLISQWRVVVAGWCKDCDDLPRVSNAGDIVEGDPDYQVMHNGIKVGVESYHGQWMVKLIQKLKGCHEPQEERVFHEVLKAMPRGAVMLELGAFWAYYSLWFHASVQDAENHMIEPMADKIQMGQKNFALNDAQGSFTRAFIGKHSDPNATFTDWDGSKINLPMVSVDDYLDEHDIPLLHILHADIQGSELDMLRGCERAIAQHRIGFFFISTHGDKHELCLDFLRKNDVPILAEHTIDESYSADGLIVAGELDAITINPITISKRPDILRIRLFFRKIRGWLREPLTKLGLIKAT